MGALGSLRLDRLSGDFQASSARQLCGARLAAQACELFEGQILHVATITCLHVAVELAVGIAVFLRGSYYA